MSIHDLARAAAEAVYDAELARLNAVRVTLEGEAVARVALIASLQAEIARLESVEADALGTIAGLRAQVADLRAQLDAIDLPRTALVGAYNGTSGSADALFAGFGMVQTTATSYYTTSGPRPMPVPQGWDVTRVNAGVFPQVHFQSTQNGVQEYFWQDVADGLHDAWFIAMAKKLHADFGGNPFSFTFDGEPEVRVERAGTGNWIEADPRNTPAAYAAAFRHLVTVMRPHAPAMDSRWWIAGHQRNAAMEVFYPGDEFVDSIGVDPYIWGHDAPSTGPLDKWGPVVQWVRSRAFGQGKPIGISETGFARSHGDVAQAAFWAKVPAAVKQLDLSWVVLFNRGDFKMDDLPLGRAAFVEAMRQITAGV